MVRSPAPLDSQPRSRVRGSLILAAPLLAGASALGQQTTERVSVDSSGNEGNDQSWLPDVSDDDGRCVAFVSYANNLVPGDTNGNPDVFVHDRQTGITERVSVDSFGNEDPTAFVINHASSISADGRYVGSPFPFDEDYCPTPVSYCTAGSSASGCQAPISSIGTPSASAPNGFLLLAAGVEGKKDGLFFFGTNGRQANPWGNGSSFQCVVPPLKRGSALQGVGTIGACNGTFAYDLNAHWTAKPGSNPGSGVLVQAQLWYRDPQSTSNQTTSLSDALEFGVCPR